MLSRFTESDGSVIALFPFKRISHQFMLTPWQEFEPDKEKHEVQKVRTMLADVKGRVEKFVVSSEPRVLSKVRHYVTALERQLEACDRTDEIIDRLKLAPTRLSP